MQIQPATFADLETLERLRLQTFSVTDTSTLCQVPQDVQLKVRLQMWQFTPNVLKGLWVAWDGDQLVGTVAVGTTETTLRFAWAQLAALRHLGLWPMLRYLGVWALTHYEPGPEEAYLYGIVVDPAYRRRGLAAELMTTAEAQARGWGKQLATGFIERSNTPSLQMVQKLGYQRVEQQRNALRRMLAPHPTFVRVEKAL